jgi:hypothetical protein
MYRQEKEEVEISQEELANRIQADYKKATGMELAPVFLDVISDSVLDFLEEKGIFEEDEEDDLFND